MATIDQNVPSSTTWKHRAPFEDLSGIRDRFLDSQEFLPQIRVSALRIEGVTRCNFTIPS